MPFTFAHPAIVLPFVNSRKVSATGLIIGAMSPDFEYFLRMQVTSTVSHTILGLFLFNLPLAIALSFVFHQILKKPLLANLPAFFQVRLVSVAKTDWLKYFKNNFPTVFLSIIIGAVSHIFWDAFTHKTGFFVVHNALLQSKQFGIPMYKFLQHGSTLLGLLFIAVVIWKLPVMPDFKYKPNRKYWMAVFLLTLVFQSLRFGMGRMSLTIGNLIVSSISVFLVALIITSLVYAFQKRK